MSKLKELVMGDILCGDHEKLTVWVGWGVAGDFFAAGQNYVQCHDCELIGQTFGCVKKKKSLYSNFKFNL